MCKLFVNVKYYTNYKAYHIHALSKEYGTFLPVAAEFSGKILNSATQNSLLSCPYKLTEIQGLSKLGSIAQIMTGYSFSLLIFWILRITLESRHKMKECCLL